MVYLDSSACIRRYVLEEGSEEARKAYIRAYSGEVTLSMSIWNVGEVLGALDRALRRGRLDASAHSTAHSRFLSET
ncbi:MAG TPA: PIN domain nuclease, partial [Candidatus Korarchaeota archaeon]|nr:PIN domain nuclease [Candidatus Korarchaeota archaeon]